MRLKRFRGNLQIALLALLTLFGGEFLHFAGHGHAGGAPSAAQTVLLAADGASSRETPHFVCGEFCPVCAGMLELDVPAAAIALPDDFCAESRPVPPDMPRLTRFIVTASARAPPAQA